MPLSDGYKAIGPAWAGSTTKGTAATDDRINPDDNSLQPPIVLANGWPASFSDDMGSGATGTATVSSGAVTGVNVTDGGINYAVAPSVWFVGGGGSGARATATVASGGVTSVSVDEGGTGYTSAPTVAFRVGLTPRRKVFNELEFRKDSALLDIRNYGILPWDTDVDTLVGGMKQVIGVLYRATADNGPTYSNAINPTTMGQTVWEVVGGSLGAPAAPAAPTAVAGNGTLDWSWACPKDNGAAVTAFDLQWRVQGGSYTTVANLATGRYLLAGLTNGSVYEAQVLARNSQGDSLYGALGMGTPVAAVPGGGSTLALRADTGGASGEIDLEWLAPDNGGASIIDYTYQWKAGSASYSSSRQSTSTGTSGTRGGLTNGTDYDFRVRARNSVGSGAWSNEDSATPAAPFVPPTPPADTAPNTPTAPSGTPRLPLIVDWTWELVDDDGGATVTSYDHQWRYGGANWSGNITSGIDGAYIRITVADATRDVEARVRATNSVGTSGFSGEGTVDSSSLLPPTPPPPADTAPDAPDAPGFDVIDFETILWRWSFPDDDGGQPISSFAFQWRIQGNNWSGNIVSITESCYLHENRAESTTYEGRVSASNSVGTSGWSGETPATTPAQPVVPPPPVDTAPNAPDAPERDVIDFETILWRWSFPDDDGGQPISSFAFQWRIQGNNWSGNIVSITESCYLHENRAESTTYEGRVSASNSVGTSGWSGETPATTPAQPVVPPPPVDTAPDTPDMPAPTVISDTEILWTWAAPDDGGAQITAYDIQWRLDGNVWSGNIVNVDESCYLLTLLAAATAYDARVRATNSVGTSSFSMEGQATTDDSPITSAIPDIASAPDAQAGNGEVRWVATPPSDNGSDITEYQWQWRATNGTFATVTTTLPAFTQDSLANGQAYEAQVRATNSVGQQTTWSPSGTVTPQAAAPDAVQVVVLTNLNNGMRADWGEPEANGAAITGYRLQFADNSTFSSPTSRTLGATTTTRTETGLTEGTTYYFRVRAVNSAGNGSYSPTASLERDDLQAVPGLPTNLTATPRIPLIVDFIWEVPNSNGGQRISGYDIQWRYDGDAWSGNLFNVERTTYRITVANANVGVQARVRAINSVGSSGWLTGSVLSAGSLLGFPTQRHRFTSSSQTWNLALRRFGAGGVGSVWAGQIS